MSQVEVSKLVGYAVVDYPEGRVGASKLVAYAVMYASDVGRTLEGTSDGEWTNEPDSFSYQWLRDGADIPGAKSSSYIVVAEDVGAVLTRRVTATNAAGSGNALSNAVGPIQ